MLPIAQRELLAAARDRRVYTGRIRFGLVEVVAALILLWSNSGTRSSPGRAFWFMAGVALLFCLLDGLRKAAESISQEQREGTLGLLFLSGLGGSGIVFGKFAAILVRSANGLIAFVPILAVALLFGGITGGEFWRTILVLVATLFASGAICLSVSAVTTKNSVVWAVIILFVLCIAPLAVGAGLAALRVRGGEFAYGFSPLFLFKAGSDAGYSFTPERFWIGLIELGAASLACLSFASWVLPRTWQKERVRVRTQRIQSPRSRRRRAALLEENPFLWLTYEPRRSRSFNILIGLLFCSAAGFDIVAVLLDSSGDTVRKVAPAVTFAIIGLILLALSVHLAIQSATGIAELRQNQMLDLLLLTPFNVAEINAGHWLALQRVIKEPLYMVLVLALFALFLGRIIPFGAPAVLIGYFVLQIVLGYFVLGWIGLWMGLQSTPGAAAFKTIMIGLVLPYVLFCIPSVLIQGLLIYFARKKVTKHFRHLISERYLLADGLLPPGITVAGSAQPPVIR